MLHLGLLLGVQTLLQSLVLATKSLVTSDTHHHSSAAPRCCTTLMLSLLLLATATMAAISTSPVPLLYWQRLLLLQMPSCFCWLLPVLLLLFVCFGAALNQRRRAAYRLYSTEDFEDFGFGIIGCKRRGSSKSRLRRFKAHFGAEPAIVAIIWRELAWSGWLRFAGRTPKPEHLLWALLFLKNYSTEEIHATLVHSCEKTFRKWAWFYALGIANLDRKFVSACLAVVSALLSRLVCTHPSFIFCSCLLIDPMGESIPRQHWRTLPCYHRWSRLCNSRALPL